MVNFNWKTQSLNHTFHSSTLESYTPLQSPFQPTEAAKMQIKSAYHTFEFPRLTFRNSIGLYEFWLLLMFTRWSFRLRVARCLEQWCCFGLHMLILEFLWIWNLQKFVGENWSKSIFALLRSVRSFFRLYRWVSFRFVFRWFEEFHARFLDCQWMVAKNLELRFSIWFLCKIQVRCFFQSKQAPCMFFL